MKHLVRSYDLNGVITVRDGNFYPTLCGIREIHLNVLEAQNYEFNKNWYKLNCDVCILIYFQEKAEQCLNEDTSDADGVDTLPTEPLKR